MERDATISNGARFPPSPFRRMERDATISNGDGTLMLQYSPTKDSLKNIGGGGGDGELKAIKAEIGGLKAEIGGLKAEKQKLQGELRELGVVAIHRLEGEIERAHADLGAAASAAMKSRALAEELKAERDKLVAEIASLSAAVEVKEKEITALEQNVWALMKAKEEAAKASAEREDDQRTRNLLLVKKIQGQNDVLMKLSARNFSLEQEIIKLQDALFVLEGKIGEKKKKKNAAEATAASSAAAELGAIALWAVSVAAATVAAVYLQR